MFLLENFSALIYVRIPIYVRTPSRPKLDDLFSRPPPSKANIGQQRLSALSPETKGPETLSPETLSPETLGPETLGSESSQSLARPSLASCIGDKV